MLVVFGHMLEPYIISPINLISYLGIYSFHMPLFIIISGFFFNLSVNKKKLVDSSIKFIESFLIFSILIFLFRWVDGEELNLIDYISPPWVMWYLLSLVCWRIVTFYLIHKFNINITSKKFIILASILSLLIGFIPVNNHFALQRTFAFYPFFLTGIYFQKHTPSLPKIRYAIPIIICLFLILYILIKFEGRMVMDLRKILYCNREYSSMTDGLLRLFALSNGMIISWTVFAYFPTIKLLATIGVKTLPIYLWHIFPIKILSHLIDAGVAPCNIISLMGYSLATCAIIYFLSQLNISHWLQNPVTNLLKKG